MRTAKVGIQRYIMYVKGDERDNVMPVIKDWRSRRDVKVVKVHEKHGLDGIFIFLLQEANQIRSDFFEEGMQLLRDLKKHNLALSIMTFREEIHPSKELYNEICYSIPYVFVSTVKSHSQHYAKGDNNTTKLREIE